MNVMEKNWIGIPPILFQAEIPVMSAPTLIPKIIFAGRNVPLKTPG